MYAQDRLFAAHMQCQKKVEKKRYNMVYLMGGETKTKTQA